MKTRYGEKTIRELEQNRYKTRTFTLGELDGLIGRFQEELDNLNEKRGGYKEQLAGNSSSAKKVRRRRES
jgi:hypothetical protein